MDKQEQLIESAVKFWVAMMQGAMSHAEETAFRRYFMFLLECEINRYGYCHTSTDGAGEFSGLLRLAFCATIGEHGYTLLPVNAHCIVTDKDCTVKLNGDDEMIEVGKWMSDNGYC